MRSFTSWLSDSLHFFLSEHFNDKKFLRKSWCGKRSIFTFFILISCLSWSLLLSFRLMTWFYTGYWAFIYGTSSPTLIRSSKYYSKSSKIYLYAPQNFLLIQAIIFLNDMWEYYFVFFIDFLETSLVMRQLHKALDHSILECWRKMIILLVPLRV